MDTEFTFRAECLVAGGADGSVTRVWALAIVPHLKEIEQGSPGVAVCGEPLH